jgi:hypothetical protein
MKSIVMPKTVALNEETKKQLQQEIQPVKETVAGNDVDEIKFTAVDMWNRQRQSKSASKMMRWNMN